MTVEEKLSLAERLTAEANDYRDIYNAVSGMMYYLQVQKHREILNLFWSRREDISFSTAKGRAAVEDFFIRETDGNRITHLFTHRSGQPLPPPPPDYGYSSSS